MGPRCLDQLRPQGGLGREVSVRNVQKRVANQSKVSQTKVTRACSTTVRRWFRGAAGIVDLINVTKFNKGGDFCSKAMVNVSPRWSLQSRWPPDPSQPTLPRTSCITRATMTLPSRAPSTSLPLLTASAPIVRPLTLACSHPWRPVAAAPKAGRPTPSASSTRTEKEKNRTNKFSEIDFFRWRKIGFLSEFPHSPCDE